MKKPSNLIDEDDLDISKMNLIQLNILLKSLDSLYLNQLKDLCRANNIVHTGRIKTKLSEELYAFISQYQKKAKAKANAVAENDAKAKAVAENDEKTTHYLNLKDYYMKFTKDALKDIFKTFGYSNSALSKEEMIESIIKSVK